MRTISSQLIQNNEFFNLRPLIGVTSLLDRFQILEDLSCEDYHMVCEKLILDEEHLELALKSLSAMHASSLILEEKKGTHLDKIYPDIFKEIMFDENNLEAPTRRWLLKGINDLQVGVDHLQKYTLSEKILIKKKLPQILMKIYPLSKKSQRYTNVLVHGDMWRNNILFRHEEGKPIDCKLVDYQFARYAPPAHDVMQLLHLTTAKEFRNTHEKRLLHYYHDRLRENLQKHDYDIDKTYPWNVFNECCQHYKLLALIQSILSLHYLLGPADQKVDSILTSPKEYDEYMSKHREIYMKKYFNDPNYEKKISEIYHEIIRNFIL